MHPDSLTSPFSDLLGQQRAKTLLTKSLSSGRIAHAYLFRGADGIGKKLFAKAMAMALSCKNCGPATSCGTCISCRKFLSDNHPDYVVESPAKGTIKIDRVRSLCKSLTYPPYESQRRVVVIEDIHTMRQEAANSLLKTLEEPPVDNVLILTAEASKSILPTIRSRCQIVPFYPLRVDETISILMKDHGIAEEEGRLLARLSEGSPGKALLLHKHDMIDTWQRVVEGLTDERYREDRYCTVLLQLAQQMAELKENLLPLLGLLRIWLRDSLVDGLGGPNADPHKPQSFSVLFAKLQALSRAEQELARNCNRALVCEILLFRLQ